MDIEIFKLNLAMTDVIEHFRFEKFKEPEIRKYLQEYIDFMMRATKEKKKIEASRF